MRDKDADYYLFGSQPVNIEEGALQEGGYMTNEGGVPTCRRRKPAEKRDMALASRIADCAFRDLIGSKQ